MVFYCIYQEAGSEVPWSNGSPILITTFQPSLHPLLCCAQQTGVLRMVGSNCLVTIYLPEEKSTFICTFDLPFCLRPPCCLRPLCPPGTCPAEPSYLCVAELYGCTLVRTYEHTSLRIATETRPTHNTVELKMKTTSTVKIDTTTFPCALCPPSPAPSPTIPNSLGGARLRDGSPPTPLRSIPLDSSEHNASCHPWSAMIPPHLPYFPQSEEHGKGIHHPGHYGAIAIHDPLSYSANREAKPSQSRNAPLTLADLIPTTIVATTKLRKRKKTTIPS
jgi:hypothetical protein